MPLIMHGSPIARGLTNSSEALTEYQDREEKYRANRVREALAARGLDLEERRTAALEDEQKQRAAILKQQAAMLAEQKQARKEAADAEMFGLASQYAQPGVQGPAALNLPPELWEDYHNTVDALGKTEDPRVRAQLADEARARWTSYTLDKKRKEVVARIDATLQGFEAEGEQQGPKVPAAQQEGRAKLEQLRDLVASGKVDPLQAESAIVDYQHQKSQEEALRAGKEFVVNFIEQEKANTRSVKDRRQLDQIQAGVRSGFITDPEKAYIDAVAAIHGFTELDQMQGSGRPFSEAPSKVRASIKSQAWKDALDYLGKDPAFQKDAGGTSEAFRSRFQELVQERTQDLARANGWSEDLPSAWGMTPGAPGPAIDFSQMTPNGPDQSPKPADTSALEGYPPDVLEAARAARDAGDEAKMRAILRDWKVDGKKPASAKAGPIEGGVKEGPGRDTSELRAKSGGPF